MLSSLLYTEWNINTFNCPLKYEYSHKSLFAAVYLFYFLKFYDINPSVIVLTQAFEGLFACLVVAHLHFITVSEIVTPKTKHYRFWQSFRVSYLTRSPL